MHICLSCALLGTSVCQVPASAQSIHVRRVPLVPGLVPLASLTVSPAQQVSRDLGQETQGHTWEGGGTFPFVLMTPLLTFCAGPQVEIAFLLILGMYCSAPGLSQPSGFCYSGYHCAKGAISPAPFKHRVSESPAAAL